MYCQQGPDWLPLQVHEIERKSQAPKRWGSRSNYLLLCQNCHAGPFANMDHPAQLSVKLLRDPDHFNLPEWLMLRDPELRAPLRVRMRDVVQYLRLIGGSSHSEQFNRVIREMRENGT
jgi:hypothetical protein